MICKQCKNTIYENELVFIPKKGFWPDGSVKNCYCESCAKRHHYKVNYKAVFKINK